MTLAHKSIWQKQIRTIQAKVCKDFRVSMIDLISHRRAQSLVRPRHIAMWLCYKLTTASFPQIARNFSSRDHAGIMYAVRVVDMMMVTDAEYRRRVNALLMSYHGK